MQIMTTKRRLLERFTSPLVLNGVIFRQISYDIVPYVRHFLPVKCFFFFFPKYYFNQVNYASSVSQSVSGWVSQSVSQSVSQWVGGWIGE